MYSALRNAQKARLGTRGEQHRVALAVGDRVFIWYTHLVSACAELCDAASISVGDSLLAAGERRDRRVDGGFGCLALHSPPGQGKPGYQASQPAYRVSSCSPAKPVATPCLLLLGNLAQGQRWCKCPDRSIPRLPTLPPPTTSCNFSRGNRCFSAKRRALEKGSACRRIALLLVQSTGEITCIIGEPDNAAS